MIQRYTTKAYKKFRFLTQQVQFILNPSPPLVCGTLDNDDALIARKQLKDQKDWINVKVEKQFSDQFARWNGSKHAFSFLSGRAALSACIFALGLMPEDEVIVPGYTCVVVPNAFDFAKVKVVYCDIELETYGLDISEVKRKITPKTKAILIQHLYGLVCRDYEALIDFAKDHDLKIIEDCAHSTGAIFRNKKIGNMGNLAFYSSELSKIFNTIQGGVVTTNDDSLAENLSRFSEHSAYPDYERIKKQLFNLIVNYYRFKHPLKNFLGPQYENTYKNMLYDSTSEEEIMGFKPKDYGCKMPAAIALLGINQLKKIDYYNQKRRQGAKRWAQWCGKYNYNKPLVIPESIPVFLRYPVLVGAERKRDLAWADIELGFRPGRWFLSNIHPSKRSVIGCPNADRAVRECINFPTLN